MKTYAQFIGAMTADITDQVQVTITAPVEYPPYVFQLADMYTPRYIQDLVECPEGTEENCMYDRHGDQHWTNPNGSTCAGVGSPWVAARR